MSLILQAKTRMPAGSRGGRPVRRCYSVRADSSQPAIEIDDSDDDVVVVKSVRRSPSAPSLTSADGEDAHRAQGAGQDVDAVEGATLARGTR